MPFYIGDYLRDTRILPLNVRGGYIDIMLAMWSNNPPGEFAASIEEYSRIMSCGVDEANLVIQTLIQKNIICFEILPNLVYKITSAKQKKMIELSEIRKKAGFLGGNPKLIKKLVKQKVNHPVEYENEYENENNIELYKEENTEILKSWKLWLKHKPKKYKNKVTENIGFNQFKKMCGGDPVTGGEIVNRSIANNWTGLFPLKENENGKPGDKMQEMANTVLNAINKRNAKSIENPVRRLEE